jgi:DNA-binding protein H-NS
MTKTYAQLQKEIAELEAKASKVRQAEVAGVIAKMKAAIEAYGLTAQDLFGQGAVAGRRGRVTFKTKSKQSQAARYADASGNTWVGRGPRPQWVRDALAAGKSLSDFEVGAASRAGTTAAVSRKAAAKRGPAKRRKGVSRAKFKDSTGNTWTGHGKRPNWFKEALASGKSPEELMA